MISSLLIANRGEIARRIIRTARRMGIRTIAVTTEADRTWPHWREADEAILIGAGPAAESYLSIDAVLGAARQTGAEAVHPGYGFLSENAGFAEACGAAGLIFVGPSPAAIRAMGSKAEAKALMLRAGMPVVPGYHGERQDPEFLKQKAYEIGYPVLIKAVSGGGGRGMRRIDRALDFEDGLAAARREAKASFGDDRVLIERYLATPRHIEVQVFGDRYGNVVHLFERDCSVQRRHQKVIEEAPAPGLPPGMRQEMGRAAVAAAEAIGYVGAGTVEFIADASDGLRPDGFYFMEMNTRLQVEHPVTEAVTGLDLVEWQLRVASGEPLPLRQDEIPLGGHAIEVRIYAEDPANGFRPSTGRIHAASFPEAAGIRVDSGIEEGSVVGPFYDAMLAKLIAVAADRAEALERLRSALAETCVVGPKTNLALLSAVVAHPRFASGEVDADFVDRELASLVPPQLDPGLAGAVVAGRVAREAAELAQRATGPWSRTDAFELGGLSRRYAVELEVEGQKAIGELAWRGGVPETVAVAGAPAQLHEGRTAWAGRDAYLFSAGRQLHLSFTDVLAREALSADSGREIVAPMHGRVAVVAVAAGGRVEKGDLLFTLEAMKLEHSVVAPRAGIVRSLSIETGMQLEQGAPAVTIEPEELDA